MPAEPTAQRELSVHVRAKRPASSERVHVPHSAHSTLRTGQYTHRMMTPEQAEAIATVLYHGRVDWSSVPEIEHLRYVAHHVKPRSQVPAWLHDAIEDGLTTLAALREAGLSDVHYKALFLLTHLSDQETYLDYIRCIKNADGEAGNRTRDQARR